MPTPSGGHGIRPLAGLIASAVSNNTAVRFIPVVTIIRGVAFCLPWPQFAAFLTADWGQPILPCWITVSASVRATQRGPVAPHGS
jgi:hypothetical protein